MRGVDNGVDYGSKGQDEKGKKSLTVSAYSMHARCMKYIVSL